MNDGRGSRIPMKFNRRLSTVSSKKSTKTMVAEKQNKISQIISTDNQIQENQSQNIEHEALYASIASGAIKSAEQLNTENNTLKQSLTECLQLLESCQLIQNTVYEKCNDYPNKLNEIIQHFLHDYEEKIEQLNHIDSIAEKINQLTAIYSEKIHSLRDSNTSDQVSSEIQKELENLTEEIQEKTSMLQDLQNKVSEYEQKQAKIEEENKALVLEIEDIKSSKSQESGNEENPVLLSRIKDLEDINAKQLQRIKYLEEEASAKNSEILTYHNKIDQLEAQQTTSNNLSRELEEKEEEIQRLKQQIYESKIESESSSSSTISNFERERIQSLELTIEKYKSLLEENNLEQVAQLKLTNEDLSSHNQSLQAQLNDLTKKLSIANEKSDDINKLKEENLQLLAKTQELEQTVKDLQQENDSAANETEKWKIQAAGNEANRNLLVEKENEIQKYKEKIQDYLSHIQQLEQEKKDQSQENALLVQRFNDSESNCKQLREKYRDLDNSTKLEIEDLSQQITDLQNIKQEKTDAFNLVVSITQEKDELKRSLEAKNQEIIQLQTQINVDSKQTERKYQLEIEDLKAQVRDRESMLDTYKTINDLMAAKSQQANQAFSAAIQQHTPSPLKTSVAISPFKPFSPRKETLPEISQSNTSNADTVLLEQQIAILKATLNESNQLNEKLRGEIKQFTNSSQYWELQKIKEEKQKLEEKLKETLEKMNEMKSTILSLSKKQEELSARALQKTTAELQVRTETMALREHVQQLSEIIKKTNPNQSIMNLISHFEQTPINDFEMQKMANSLLSSFQETYNRMVDDFSSNVFQKLVKCESKLRALSLKAASKPPKPLKYVSPRKPRSSPIKNYSFEDHSLDPHLYD